MIVDVIMPKMGESITEGTILEWRKQVGDMVEMDETLLEIGTDKVDSEIPSPAAGRLTQILAKPNTVVDVGIVIARIETDALPDTRIKPEEPDSIPEKSILDVSPSEDRKRNVTNKLSKSDQERSFYTPVVRRIMKEADISEEELALIDGLGKGGRVRKQDIMAYLEHRGSIPSAGQSEPEISPGIIPGEQVEMDHVRKLIAAHMRNSLDTSAHVHVVTEVDMSAIMETIQRESDSFKEREEFKLTMTPFIAMAVVQALKTIPEMNASLEGTSIIYHKHISLGLAVATDNGLLVPVIPNCEELNFLELCRKVTDVARRTRNKQISPDELQGSTFSITNFGVFNVTMGIPIINQPNVGILGIGTVRKRPVVIESDAGDSVGIKSMMNLSLGFDHRLIDGAGGSRFIDRVRHNLETLDVQGLF